MAVLGLVACCGSAIAVQPVKGGRYVGRATSNGRRVGHIAFNVGDTGKALASDDRGYDSSLDYHGPCSIGYDWVLAELDASAHSGDGQMRITAGGRLSFRGTREIAGGTRTVTLAGRFNGNGRSASGVFKVTGRQDGGNCASGRVRFHAHFTGQRHLLHGTCNPPKTRTLARTADGRIYEQRYIEDNGRRDNTAAYGCLYALHERFFLAFTDNIYFQYAGFFRLAGHFTGFEVDDCPTFDCDRWIDVVDLSTGLLLRESVAAPQLKYSDLVYGLVLASDGAVAWLSCYDEPCEVDKLDGPQATPLDAGTEIDDSSLRLNGTTLSWRNNGETKTATLQ